MAKATDATSLRKAEEVVGELLPKLDAGILHTTMHHYGVPMIAAAIAEACTPSADVKAAVAHLIRNPLLMEDGRVSPEYAKARVTLVEHGLLEA